MKITSKIIISGDAKELKQLFLSEDTDLKSDRAKCSFAVKDNDLLITIDANDSTAFRAMINSISKLISIYEKTNSVIDNEN